MVCVGGKDPVRQPTPKTPRPHAHPHTARGRARQRRALQGRLPPRPFSVGLHWMACPRPERSKKSPTWTIFAGVRRLAQYVYMYICVYVYVHTCTYVYMYVYMYICIHVYMHTCIYVHIYMYICI